MSADNPPIGDDDIDAFIDGRLPPARAAAVERFLSSEPTAQARVAADQMLRDDLRARLAHAAASPIPARLRIASIQAQRRATRLRRLRQVAACVVLVLAGLGAGWEVRGLAQPTTRPVMQAEAMDAIAAHRVFVVETAHPVEVAATQQAHLVQWLSRRVGHPLTAPDLAAQGYELMGGRVLPSGGAAAAQFMYDDRAGHRLTVFVRASDSANTAFQFLQSDGFAAFSWVDAGLGFALVANVDRSRLLQIANATYHQLDPQAPPPTVAQ